MLMKYLNNDIYEFLNDVVFHFKKVSKLYYLIDLNNNVTVTRASPKSR